MKARPILRDDSLERYLADLREIPAIPPDDLSALFSAAAGGDETARERIVLAHLPLVVRIACQYAGYGLPLSDLVSEGNLGLCRAAELFEPRFGVAFSTYAGVWIKQRMHRAITAQAHAVRIPVWRSQRLRRLDRLHEALTAELGREATTGELAERIGLEETRLEEIAADRLAISSLSDPEGANEVLSLPDPAAPNPGDRLGTDELREEIIAALHGLTDEELRVIGLKLGLLDDEPLSYREMAPRFGRSREWVRRIGEGALAKAAESLRKAGDLPRRLVRRRRDRAKKRLEALATKTAPLSLPPAALMPWLEPILAIL